MNQLITEFSGDRGQIKYKFQSTPKYFVQELKTT